jgi:hypothetical protein
MTASGICPGLTALLAERPTSDAAPPRRPGIDMPAMPVGPLGDAMI